MLLHQAAPVVSIWQTHRFERRHIPKKTHTSCSHIDLKSLASSKWSLPSGRTHVRLHGAVCVRTSTHVREVEKHTSLPHYRGRQWEVWNRHRDAHGPVYIHRTAAVVWQLFTIYCKLRHARIKTFFQQEQHWRKKCSYSIQQAKVRSSQSQALKQKGKRQGVTDSAAIRANFLSLVLCMFCSEWKQAPLGPGAMEKQINLMG